MATTAALQGRACQVVEEAFSPSMEAERRNHPETWIKCLVCWIVEVSAVEIE
jgi:hypothetical protein